MEVGSDAGLTRSFFVTQQGNRPPEAVSGLSLNPEAMTMGGSSGAVGFTLKSDKPWTVTADADWLHPGSTRGNAGTTYFRLRFDQNTTGAVRTGKLTFTTTDGKATKTFTLTQRVGSAKPKPSEPSEGTYDYDLAVNPESITLSGEGGGSSIDVVTHRLWAGSTADDGSPCRKPSAAAMARSTSPSPRTRPKRCATARSPSAPSTAWTSSR